MSETVFVSRFPDRITPGALPILPSVISIHDRHGGGFIVFQWFDGAGPCEIQSAPHFCDTLAEAWECVPRGYEPTACPEEFARMAYRLPLIIVDSMTKSPISHEQSLGRQDRGEPDAK